MCSFINASCTFTLIFLLTSAGGDMVNYINYAFPGINGDLTKVTWEHRVNSKDRLEEALRGDKMMIEADVSLGRWTDSTGGILMPIMAHPPDNSSDLSLSEFLDRVLKEDKGVKLDFKSREAFSYSERVILDALLRSEMPSEGLWLNADILQGPINCNTTPVDADYFLSTCVSRFPKSVVSVGWTTCYSPDNSIGEYSLKMIGEMVDRLMENTVMGEVTFAVRAGLAAQSVSQLTGLIKTSPAATLTIWCSDESDPIDLPSLKQLIDNVGRDKVFLDVPESVAMKIQASSASSLLPVLTAIPLLLLFL